MGDIHGYCQVQTANLPIMPDFVPDKAPDKAFKGAEYKDFVYRIYCISIPGLFPWMPFLNALTLTLGSRVCQLVLKGMKKEMILFCLAPYKI